MQTNVSYLVFYNVENLFPAVEEGFGMKSELFSWSKKRYEDKIHKISRVIHWIAEEKQKFPLLIGLAEVADDKVLEDLISKIDQPNYQFVHFDSLDERGIDTALIYDDSRIKLLNSQSISFVFDAENMESENYDTTRDVLECEFQKQGLHLFVYVLHLPSKREKNINEDKRIFILKHISNRVLELKQMHPQAEFILMGDFNTNPDEQSLLDFVENTQFPWVNPFYAKFKQEHYTSYFHKKGMLFDQVMFSTDLNEKWLDAEIFNPQNLRVKSKKINHLPFRTYVGTRYQGGYSDHFPVLISLNL